MSIPIHRFSNRSDVTANSKNKVTDSDSLSTSTKPSSKSSSITRSLPAVDTSLPFSPLKTCLILLLVALYSFYASTANLPPYNWFRSTGSITSNQGGLDDNHDRVVQHRPAFKKADRSVSNLMLLCASFPVPRDRPCSKTSYELDEVLTPFYPRYIPYPDSILA